MEPQEVDSALDELENRLDRLRSLYEQYFMGIEKIEPTVPRKDVDRRFWILRRTQIRNTARRFRLQTLVQRYNTFQQHWARVCREIENGTYVRHLLKAQKNLGIEPTTWAAKKRLGLFRRDRVGPDGAPIAGGPESSPPPSNGRAGTVRPSVRPSAPPSMPPSSRPEPSLPPPAPALSSAAVAPVLSSAAERRTTTESVATFRLQQAELRPLDLDLEDAPTLPPPARVAKPARPAPSAARPAQPAPGIARPAQSAPMPPGKAPGPAAPASARPAPPRPQSAIPRPAAAAPQPPPPQAAPAPPPGQRPAMPAGASVAQKPAAPAVSRPGAPAQAPKPAANGVSSGASGLSDERVRQLHAELSAARKQLNQGATLSVDSLAKTLRDTEAKLRSQHAGKAVDFQIVIKDGKPIVKPVVRR